MNYQKYGFIVLILGLCFIETKAMLTEQLAKTDINAFIKQFEQRHDALLRVNLQNLKDDHLMRYREALGNLAKNPQTTPLEFKKFVHDTLVWLFRLKKEEKIIEIIEKLPVEKLKQVYAVLREQTKTHLQERFRERQQPTKDFEKILHDLARKHEQALKKPLEGLTIDHFVRYEELLKKNEKNLIKPDEKKWLDEMIESLELTPEIQGLKKLTPEEERQVYETFIKQVRNRIEELKRQEAVIKTPRRAKK